MSVEYFGQHARLSEATVANGFVFLSGMVPENTEQADAKTQTADVLAQIDSWLQQCGSNKKPIVEATIYLNDMADYDVMNEACGEWVDPQHSPARACIEAKLAKPEWKVEIKVSAVQIK